MKRRQFIHTAAGTAVSLPVFLNGIQVSATPSTSLFNLVNPDLDRALVLIRLNGGNDGLNTVLPLDQYDGMAEVRPNILVPRKFALKLEDNVGFHPSMKTLKWMYDYEKVGVVQSVGYPNQNRSHFRSTDIWSTGSPADEFWTSGWFGRYLDTQYPGFPDDYPNDQHPDPFAVTMGYIVSETCQGLAGNFSMTINDPFNLSPLAIGNDDQLPETPYGDELEYLRIMVAQTNAYSESVTRAANKGNNIANYPEKNRLAQQLKNVALLISGGLRSKLYIVSIGGFDTHANQTDGTNTTVGEHANLLRTLSDAIAAFQEDLEFLRIQDRVMGVTFSEFGRQIHSNDSFGTDHGTAAPLILFGSCVNNQVLGDNPTIDKSIGRNEGLPMQYDFRDIYGSILVDWFELQELDIKTLLYEDFQYFNLATPCNTPIVTTSNQQRELEEKVNLTNYPNPFRDWTTISFNSEREWVKLSIYDALGKELKVLFNKQLSAGEHQVNWEARGLPAGNYFYRLQLGSGYSKTKRMIKQ